MAGRDDIKAIAADAERFREMVNYLYRLRPNDWTDWELDWMEAQLRRSDGYKHSEKEQAILIHLHGYAARFSRCGGCSAEEAVRIAYKGRFDLSEAQFDFVEMLHNKGVTVLLKRQRNQLRRILVQIDALEEEAA